MRTDIDYLINLMERYTTSKSVKELGEQDGETSSGGSTGGGSKNNVTTWAGTVGASLNRSGPANPISNKPRPDRVGRSGPANQIGNTKWSDTVKLGRGPANQLT
jgi:hypothetical protein